jgi:glycosyltransferase involved in cell wall biosynthesis
MNKDDLLKVSIVVPAYKEEKNIYRTVSSIVEAHDALPYSYEVIVVVDGSPDKTADEARRVKSPHVKVLEYQPNHGKGYALKYGTQHAKGEIITFTDAGGDFNPKQFDRCIKLMEAFDADFVIGSKRHPASNVNYPFLRRIYSKGYQLLVRILFGLNVTDTQTGLKFLRRKVAMDVVPRVLVKQYAFDLEMLVVARQLGYKRIFEAPVEMDFNASGSGITFKAIRNMFRDTLAIFYRARILHYYTRQVNKQHVSA